MGASADPANSNVYNKAAGPFGWAIAVVTGVVFLGLLYQTAMHGDDHGGDHGGDHAADHAAEPDAAKPADAAH